MQRSIYDFGLEKTAANHTPLTPLSFLARAAEVYPERLAVVHGETRYTWRETADRCRRLASALAARGVGPGDTVAAMLPNTPPMIEAHFGVPMTGAVLNALNTRLDADAIAFMLMHGEARAVLVDREFSEVIRRALQRIDRAVLVIDCDDPAYDGPGARVGEVEYEALLAEGDPAYESAAPADEWDAIALNYTSGTTGNPKGVVYHHRGAHLNAISNVLEWDIPQHPVYLWTLPLFHCNGWCFAWTIAARAGVNVCLRRVDLAAIFARIREHRVTHYCGAPIVHNLLANAPAALREGISHKVHAMVAGPRRLQGARRSSRRWRRSGSTSRTPTGSPRPTAPRRCARSTRGGARSTSAPARGSTRGRACVTTSRAGSPCATRRPSTRCPPTARPWAS